NIFFKDMSRSLNLGSTDEDMARIYQISDVYATFASGEGFGFPIIEAEACGIPVVAVDFTTSHELIIEPEAGLAPKPITTWASSFNVRHAMPDVDASVDALSTLYENKLLRKQMGINGRKFIEERCDWDKIVEQWKEIFK
ncbi:MAG: glycosyltransferase family 4 protein, partial [Candidatus Peribacteraceae bacterium]|nr:glycosyltransferase family 4 protein [Candidatus Peribacteraceae bacterium]